MDLNNQKLLKTIEELVSLEIENNPVSYNKDISYQAYERINYDGRRWSVEKRITEYNLERLYNNDNTVLDIGSNFGFFVCEFALHCKEVHGIEPNKYLNEIGVETAKYLGVEDKVKYIDCLFDDYNTECKYDVILTLASFFTQDKREKGDAQKYFGKIQRMLCEHGRMFYESTSYTKEEGDLHYHAKNEASVAIGSMFKIIEEYETSSGSDGYFRYFILAEKV